MLRILKKMYLRVSSLSVVRAGRKFSRVSTFIAIMFIALGFLFLVTLFSPDHKLPGESDILYRQENKSFGRTYKPQTSQSNFRFWGKQKGNSAKSSSTDKNTRIIELSTWTINQSLILEEYIDPTDPTSFILQPSSSPTSNETSAFCGPGVQVLIMVASAPGNQEARRAIRNSWGSKHKLWPKGGRVIFVLGSSGNTTLENLVAKESEKFGDVLEEDFHDSYHNLTLKSIAMLKWVNLTCIKNNNITVSPKYVFKTDDDIFINFDRLLRVIHELPNAKMIGRLTCGAVPIADSNSKLYMPKYLYAGPVYPGYLSGTAYVLRTDIISTLLQNALSIPLIHLEDIYVTALLARKSHIYPDDSQFFTYNRIEPKDDCAFRLLVNSHQMKPQEIQLIYSNLQHPPPAPCNLRKAKWLRRVPRLNKRLKNLCLFNNV